MDLVLATSGWVYGLWLVFCLILLGCWFLNFLGLPGNWLILLGLIGWIGLGPSSLTTSSWLLVPLVGLALLGEWLEFAASLWGTRKMGGSARGAVLSVAGALAGGLLGLVIGFPIPIPLLGSLLAALLFASLGAMVGAMLGEYSLNTDWRKNAKIGLAAFVSRLAGTFGKILVGAVMLGIAWLAPFFD
jgi:uncharacterized protein YqgC (DUF456 family)